MTTKVTKKRNKKIKLSKSEMRLLILLGAVLLGWLFYKFIYIPQTEKMDQLAIEKVELEGRITEINDVLRKEEGINREYIGLIQEKEEIFSRYFPTLEQSEMIYLINGLTEDDNVAVQSLSFVRPKDEEIADFQVKSMNVGMPYDGSYNGIMSIVKELRASSKKILVDEIVMDRTDPNTLTGSIGVKVYTLEGITDDSDIGSGIIVEKSNNEENNEPFGIFDSLLSDKTTDKEGLVDGQTGETDQIDPFTFVTLMDFESRSSYFLPSQPYVKGAVSQSTLAKSNKHSLRFEYNILAIDEDKPNKAFIDVSRNKIDLKYPPADISMWVYSYAYSPGTVGLEFKTQTGEMLTVVMTEGMGWTGWKQVHAEALPNDLKEYPLRLDSISLEMPVGREDVGVVLLDKLEAIYEKNLDEDGKDNSTNTNYFFHVVERGETSEVISQIYYGTAKYTNEINKLNELSSGETLPVGKILILKKRLVLESIFEENKKIPLPEPKPEPKPQEKQESKPVAQAKPVTNVKIDPNLEDFNHTVAKGETIYSISRKYYGNNSYAREIMQLNGMAQGDLLPVGKVLVLKKR